MIGCGRIDSVTCTVSPEIVCLFHARTWYRGDQFGNAGKGTERARRQRNAEKSEGSREQECVMGVCVVCMKQFQAHFAVSWMWKSRRKGQVTHNHQGVHDSGARNKSLVWGLREDRAGGGRVGVHQKQKEREK